MKTLALAIMLTAFSAPLRAAQEVILQPDSTLWLVGDSTLHDFTSKTQQILLQAELNPQRTGKDRFKAILEEGAIQKLKLIIPVKSLKSKEASLDKNMYKALKAEDQPEIVFELTGYEVQPSTLSASTSQIKAVGTLTVSGVQQSIELHAEALPEPAGLRVQGYYPLLMTDYGVQPPKLMMGAIKVKNEVVIHFDLRLR